MPPQCSAGKYAEIFGEVLFSKHHWMDASENSNNFFLEHKWMSFDEWIRNHREISICSKVVLCCFKTERHKLVKNFGFVL